MSNDAGRRARARMEAARRKVAVVQPPPSPLDTSKWPCELCGHGHYPGERCGANGCECRA